MKHERDLSIADIITPGDILQVLRDSLNEAHALDGVIVVAVKDCAVKVNYAGTASEVETAGYLEAAKLLLLIPDQVEYS